MDTEECSGPSSGAPVNLSGRVSPNALPHVMKELPNWKTSRSFPTYPIVSISGDVNINARRCPSSPDFCQERHGNILDCYKSIQLPLPHKPLSSSKKLAGYLTPPSELRKRSRRLKKYVGQNQAIVSWKAETKDTNRRKGRSRDCPNVFDHLAMLHRKRQRCEEERTSQEVPRSPQMEALSSDFLSMHPTPPKGVNDKEEDENRQVLETAKVSFGPDQILEEEEENETWRDSWSWKRHGWSPANSRSLPVREAGNSLEFHSSRAVPVLSMERIGPCRDQRLQLSQVPLHLSPPSPQCRGVFQGPALFDRSSKIPLSMNPFLGPFRGRCRRELDSGNLSCQLPHEE